jgi:hypothetical protein
MAMTILTRLIEKMRQRSEAKARRDALQMLLMRRDKRLLRDAGLALVDDGIGSPRCEPLPQKRERRWTAPLIRLIPPSTRSKPVHHAPAATHERGEDSRKAG